MKKNLVIAVLSAALIFQWLSRPRPAQASINLSSPAAVTGPAAISNNAIQGLSFCFNAPSSLSGATGSFTATLPFGTATFSGSNTTAFASGAGFTPITMTISNLALYGSQGSLVTYLMKGSTYTGWTTQGSISSGDAFLTALQADFKQVDSDVETGINGIVSAGTVKPLQ